MLLKIHDVVSGWIAALIVGVIIIVFAFFGIQYYFTDGSGGQNVAKVGERPISIAEYQRAYQSYRQRLQQALGDSIDSVNDEFLKQEALNQLIQSHVLTQMARDAGLRISDADVVKAIASIQAFQNDNGEFSKARYQQSVQQAGMSTGGFEQRVRTDMLQQQLQSAIVETAFITDADVGQLARIEAQTRDIGYATIPARPETVEVSDADIKQYYENNIEDYREPEKVRIAYIDLSIDDLLDDVEVSAAELKSYYDSNRSAYSVEESRKVTQMYIKLGQDPEQAEIDKARETMQFIQEKLDAGMSMDEIATQHDDRLGPDFEQIALGYSPRGTLPPALEEAVFALEEGDTTDIIRSKAGLHIARLDGIKGGEVSAFADVRDQVEADYRREQAEKLYFEKAEQLSTLTFEHPDSLEVAAEQLGVEVQTTDWFSEGSGEGIAAKPEVNMASFSDEVLNQDLNSEPIELADTRMVVLRAAEHQPEQPLPLAQVREEISDDIKYERAREQASKTGEAVFQALREGQPADAVASEYGIDWQQAESVSRDDPDISRSVLRTAFGIAPPGEQGMNYAGNSLGSGDYIVVGVSDVQTPSADTLAEDKRQELREQLNQAAAQNAWQNLIENAKADTEIQVNRQNI